MPLSQAAEKGGLKARAVFLLHVEQVKLADALDRPVVDRFIMGFSVERVFFLLCVWNPVTRGWDLSAFWTCTAVSAGGSRESTVLLPTKAALDTL